MFLNDVRRVMQSAKMSYRTIIIVHGLNDSCKDMEDLKNSILKYQPGTEVVIPALYENYHSLTNMWTQVAEFGKVIKSYSDKNPDGINIIGFSQGGLIARGVIHTVDGLNVNSFIALSSPLNGQFGDTSYIHFLPTEFRKLASYLFYSPATQHSMSVANYWKDPEKVESYEEHCEFLAPLNNESTNQDHKKFDPQWKVNFTKLKKLVLIGGKDDGVITPWQSALFGGYDKNVFAHKMEDLKIYKDDVFGLKTLDEAGKVYKYQFDGCEHTHWHGNEAVFRLAIKPHLN